MTTEQMDRIIDDMDKDSDVLRDVFGLKEYGKEDWHFMFKRRVRFFAILYVSGNAVKFRQYLQQRYPDVHPRYFDIQYAH